MNNRSLFFSLLPVLFLFSCISEYRVRVDRNPGEFVGRLEQIDQDLPYSIEVIFPEDDQGQDPEVIIQWQGGSDGLKVGLSRSSRYIVAGAVIEGKTLKVRLGFNRERLRNHRPSQEKQFSGIEILSGLGALNTGDGYCAGSLVSPNKILTAAHCVRTQKECDQASFGVWHGRAFQTRQCKSVIVANDFNDQALLELERAVHSYFQPLSILESPLHYPEDMIAYVASDFTRWNYGLRYLSPKQDSLNKSVVPCKITETLRFIFVGSNKRIEDNFKLDCQAISGQSGSPILDNDGRIIGILHSGSKQKPESFFSPLDQRIVQVLSAQ